MKIVIGADNAGGPLLKVIVAHLSGKLGIELIDASRSANGKAEFYADMTDRVVSKITAGEAERGILCCGTGIGVCISANKVPGIRAALTHDTYSAGKAATSNNAQIITMGARVIGPELAKSIVDTWLAATFDAKSASAENVAAIDLLDKKYSKAAIP